MACFLASSKRLAGVGKSVGVWVQEARFQVSVWFWNSVGVLVGISAHFNVQGALVILGDRFLDPSPIPVDICREAQLEKVDMPQTAGWSLQTGVTVFLP